jgi:hypothetical protein
MRNPLKIRRTAALMAATVAATCAFASPALAASGDRDGDGMPNRWEVRHGLDPDVANARFDADHDRLTNGREYRHHGLPRDEDTDNDGIDDGDEVLVFDTRVDDRDSDNDGRIDGEENADRDRLRNEDEDDAREACIADDDDADHDGIANEDENELHLRGRDRDSDDDGILDGNEDRDDDGVDNDDEDDRDDDRCDGDFDDDGVEDEDEDEQFGFVSSYDVVSGALTITAFSGMVISTTVTDETELEWDGDDCAGTDEVTDADLGAEPMIEEYELERSGELEELELIRPSGGHEE